MKDIAGDLSNALGDGPAVHGLEGDHFQNQQVQGALHEIGRFAHSPLLSVTDKSIYKSDGDSRFSLEHRERTPFCDKVRLSKSLIESYGVAMPRLAARARPLG